MVTRIVKNLVRRVLNRGELNLFPGEVILYETKQKRLSLSNSLFSPDIIIATNQRLRFIDSRNFGINKESHEIPYNYVTDSKVKDGLLFSTLYVKAPGRHFRKRQEHTIGSSLFNRDVAYIEIDGILSDDARELNKILARFYTLSNPSVKIIGGDVNKSVTMVDGASNFQNNFSINP